MPMMYNPAGGAQRAGGGSPPSNSRQTNLQRIDQAAMRKRKDKRPAQGQSPALPGVPQLSVAGLPEQQQQQRQQQPMQQPSQAQQSAQQQQQQGQAALPSHIAGALGSLPMAPMGGDPDWDESWGDEFPSNQPAGPNTQTLPGASTAQSLPGAPSGMGTPRRMSYGMVPIEPAPPSLPSGLPGGSGDPTTPKTDRGQWAGGTTGGADTDAGATGGTDPYANERAQAEALIAEAKADEETATQGIDADVAQSQRRQSAINARMGGAVGGGLSGGMATTAILGAREKADVAAQAREKTRNLQVAWLDKQIQLKERDIDRKYGKEMSTKDKIHEIEMEALRIQAELPPEFYELKNQGKDDEAMKVYDDWKRGGGGAQDGGGASGEGAYPGGVFGGEGYTHADRTVRVEDDGTQHWRFGTGGYEVRGNVVSLLMSQMLQELNLDPDALGDIITDFDSSAYIASLAAAGPGSYSPPDYRFGGSDASLEVQAWFSQYLDENDGEYPDRFEIRDKLKDMGVL